MTRPKPRRRQPRPCFEAICPHCGKPAIFEIYRQGHGFATGGVLFVILGWPILLIPMKRMIGCPICTFDRILTRVEFSELERIAEQFAALGAGALSESDFAETLQACRGKSVRAILDHRPDWICAECGKSNPHGFEMCFHCGAEGPIEIADSGDLSAPRLPYLGGGNPWEQ